MNIVIVGVGLIGGSFSLALRRKGSYAFGGYDLNEESLRRAKELALVDHVFATQQEAIQWADVIILTMPVNAVKAELPSIMDQLAPYQILVDFGSTKHTISKVADAHENRAQYIAAHPIAGTEHSGPEAAIEGLFDGKNLILCDTEKTDGVKLSKFEMLAEEAGFYLTKMSAEEHDRHLAYISHLSHVTSYVLSHTVLNKEKDGEVILDLAGSGFESTVRLAKSSPEMWSSIFIENKDMVLKGIAAYKQELEKLEKLILDESERDISSYLREGREIRKILK